MITGFIDDYFEQANRLVKSAHGKQLLRQRQTVIEGVFGEAKSFHLLRRALFRGKVKLKIQLLLTASVLNLKRLMKNPKKRKIIAQISTNIVNNLYQNKKSLKKRYLINDPAIFIIKTNP
ncbi:MAG: hypothetical protein GXO93_03400 [FCB group bacterium]|nr:hypothetical protein [FCB group bacterium]